MARWFRFYTEVLDDPKVQRLDAETFKAWVNILCLAGRHDGFLPEISDIAFALRIDEIAARSLVDRLRIGGLIDTVKGGANGSRIAPHGWSERQYKSDTSTDRVKRFRQRSKSVTETPPETDTEQSIPSSKEEGAPALFPSLIAPCEPSTGTARDESDKAFWDTASHYLNGKRSLIGKWCKSYGKEATARAITDAQLQRVVDPAAYVSKILAKGAASELEFPVC